MKIYGQDNQTMEQSSLTTISDDSLLLTNSPSFSYSYSSHSPIEITDDLDFTSANGVVSGSGVEEDPFIIEGWKIDASESHGIYISQTTKYFNIQKNFISAEGSSPTSAIYIENVMSGTAKIENNDCQDKPNGIFLYNSSNNFLTNNSCTNCHFGICVEESSNNNLLSNYCSYNCIGIYFKGLSNGNNATNNICNSNDWEGIKTQNYTFLKNNTCNFNTGKGIYVHGSHNYLINNHCLNGYYGISLYFSDLNKIINNTCTLNKRDGISIRCSHNNVLINNNCSKNNNGIHLTYSDNNILSRNLLVGNSYGINLSLISKANLVYHNTFIDNNRLSQAYDDVRCSIYNEDKNNVWYNTVSNEGNFWSDYSGSGDYLIAGSANSIDPYPLDENGVPYPNTSEDNHKNVDFYPFTLMLLILGSSVRKRKYNI